jgi:hypothetical protein
MAYIGQAPANKLVSASDLEDGIITNSKLAQDIISAETELATAPADTDEFLISDAGTLKRIDASLIGGGKIGQVLQAVKTDTTSTNSQSFADLTGITQAITPSATSSKILVMFDGNFSAYTTSGNGQAVDFKLLRGSTDIYIGDAASNRTRTSTNFRPEGNGQYDLNPAKIVFLDSPNTTSATTYKIQWRKCFDLGSSSHSVYLNRSYEDGDNSERPRGASSITLIEVLA